MEVCVADHVLDKGVRVQAVIVWKLAWSVRSQGMRLAGCKGDVSACGLFEVRR